MAVSDHCPFNFIFGMLKRSQYVKKGNLDVGLSESRYSSTPSTHRGCGLMRAAVREIGKFLTQLARQAVQGFMYNSRT